MKPTVQLTGEDGNAFSIIGRVSRTLKQAGQKDKADKFKEQAMECGSYEELLRLVFKYCEVE